MNKYWATYTFVIIIAGGLLAACIILGSELDKFSGF